MALEDDIKNLKQLNAEIDMVSKQLGETPKIFKKEDIDIANRYLNDLKRELRELTSDIDGITSAYRASVQEISKQNEGLNLTKRTLRS